MSEYDTTSPAVEADELPALTSLSQLGEVQLGNKWVDCPEPGWHVRIQVWEMTGDEIQWWLDGNTTTKRGRVVKTHNDTATARLFTKALKNEAGECQYTLADMKALVKRGGKVITRLERAALELSGLDGDDDEKNDGEGND